MSRGSCPRVERDGCPVAERRGGCFSDVDHRVPQRYKSLGWLVRKYIATPANKERLCRWEHEQKTETESIDLVPSEEFMLDAVRRAYAGGFINLNKRDLRRLSEVELCQDRQYGQETPSGTCLTTPSPNLYNDTLSTTREPSRVNVLIGNEN